MKLCFPERPKWPDTMRRRFWRAVPHKFKQGTSRNRCARCQRINFTRLRPPSERSSA